MITLALEHPLDLHPSLCGPLPLLGCHKLGNILARREVHSTHSTHILSSSFFLWLHRREGLGGDPYVRLLSLERLRDELI